MATQSSAIGQSFRVDRRTVGAQVADALRERILAGELRPGERLSEADLAAALDVSRGPVREAFRQLMGEGLLVHRTNRGVSVWRPTRHELWELFTLRAGIEGMAVRLALEAGRREALVAALAPVVEAMAAADRERDRRQAARLDGQFHAAIVARSGNRRIAQFWAGAHPVVWVASLPAFFPQYERPLAERHRLLLRAIAEGTAQEAQEAVIAHIVQGMGETIVPDLTVVAAGAGEAAGDSGPAEPRGSREA